MPKILISSTVSNPSLLKLTRPSSCRVAIFGGHAMSAPMLFLLFLGHLAMTGITLSILFRLVKLHHAREGHE